MQNPDHVIQGWQAIIGKCVNMRLACRWLFPGVMVMMALGISFRSDMVQAQDGGTGSGRSISAQYVMLVNASNPKLSNLCIGETFDLPVTVGLQSMISTLQGEIASYRINDATLSFTVANPSIVTASQSGFSDAQDAPFQTNLSLTGQQAGSTSITINARVQSSAMISMDEDVALPIPVPSTINPVTINVRVIPCAVRVHINSIWDTTVFGGDIILIAVAHNLQMRGLAGQTLQFDPDAGGPPFMEWTWAVNRIRGCHASSGRFDQTPPRMRGTIDGDNLALSLEYFAVAPPLYGYWDILCPPPFTVGTSLPSERPDGIAVTFPPARVPGEWEPEWLPTGNDPLLFPLNGGTLVISHPLTGRDGRATGTTIITVVPERVQ
jgi:hypothetical protein